MSGSKKYGVQADPFSKTISVGRLNKAQTLFLDKQDVTDDVLFAVAEYVKKHWGGSFAADFDAGFTLIIQVEPSPETPESTKGAQP